MMTAMDVGELPPALLRSGRVELWLEMRLPDEAARLAILGQHARSLAGAVGGVSLDALTGDREGFTGADLKRLAEDGKNLFAHDFARGRPLRPATEYFLSAIATVRANRERYAEAESRARRQCPERPSFFDLSAGVVDGDMQASRACRLVQPCFGEAWRLHASPKRR